MNNKVTVSSFCLILFLFTKSHTLWLKMKKEKVTMKKLIILLFAAMLFVSVSAVFAQEPANMEELKALDAALTEDIHIEIWGKDGTSSENSRGTIFTNFADEFSAMFDHVTIEYIHQGSYDDVRTKVMAASVAGDLPGIWMAEESTVKSFAAIAADLKQWVPEETVNDYLPGLLSSSLYDGDRLIGAPAARSNPVMFVNNEVLAAAGWTGDMIKTNDDLFQCAKDIYEKTGKAGLAAWWDTDLWHWESEIYADGGQVLTDDGSAPAFGKDYDYVGAKYMEAVKDGLVEGWITHTYSAAQPDNQLKQNFQNGEVAMMLFSNNNFTAYEETLESNGYEFSLQLQPEGTVRSIVSGGGNWMLSNTASYEEAMMAGGWLQYIASDENVLGWTNLCGAFLITESAYNSETAQAMFEANPNHLKVYETMNYLHKRVNTPYWVEMYTYMHDKLSQFALYPDSTDIYATVDDMAAKCAQIIEDNAW